MKKTTLQDLGVNIINYNKLTTKRLLNHYRAERKKYYKRICQYCTCCQEPIWVLQPSYSHYKELSKEMENYLNGIKKELNNRNNV